MYDLGYLGTPHCKRHNLHKDAGFITRSEEGSARQHVTFSRYRASYNAVEFHSSLAKVF